MWMFYRFGERGEVAEVVGTELPPSALLPADDTAFTCCGVNHNMWAALMHVLSDLLRSTTTLVEALVILTVSGADSTKADGWGTLVVCTTILCGALGAVYPWACAVAEFRRLSPEEEENGLGNGPHDEGGQPYQSNQTEAATAV
jgi:Co/Zn/Cd efflux system component